jgi:hypothetical protein
MTKSPRYFMDHKKAPPSGAFLFYLLTAPGESKPLLDDPVPLNEVGPPAAPLGPPEPMVPERIEFSVLPLLEPPVPVPVVPAAPDPLLTAAPDFPETSAPAPEPACANAKVLESANAPANAMALNVMVRFLVCG